jgi:hypothetical protein
MGNRHANVGLKIMYSVQGKIEIILSDAIGNIDTPGFIAVGPPPRHLPLERLCESKVVALTGLGWVIGGCVMKDSEGG